MTNTKKWIDDIKRVEPPDLWDRIEQGTASGSVGSPSPSPRPLLAVAILAVTALVLGTTFYWLGQFGERSVVGGTVNKSVRPAGIHRLFVSLEESFDESRSQVVAIHPRTGEAVGLPLMDGYVGDVSVSPDGRMLALAVYGEGGDYSIATMDLDGSSYAPVANFADEINGLGDVSWSPDGTRIAFATTVSPPEMTTEADLIRDLYVISLEDGSITRVTQDDHITGFSWSPDGTRFVVSRERAEDRRLMNDLFIMGVDGTDEGRLTDDGISSRPAWSLQGQIAFIGSASGDFKHRDVFILDEEGTSLVQLTDDTAVEEGLAWSADGSRLAYTKFTGPRCSVLIQPVTGDRPAKLVVDGSDMGGCPISLTW